jgi:hypothetical protein
MTKDNFTPDAVYRELLHYTLHKDHPDDELNEIGGSPVSIDGIADIEIESVTESESGFIVKGPPIMSSQPQKPSVQMAWLAQT